MSWFTRSFSPSAGRKPRLPVRQARLALESLEDRFLMSISVADFAVPTGTPGSNTSSRPQVVTLGPDNNVWFAEYAPDANGFCHIGRINAADNSIQEFAIRTRDSAPLGITKGPDGALWFTENNFDQIGRITTDGL